MSRHTITTDGSFNISTKIGGWAAVIKNGEVRKLLSGAVKNTGSYEMELLACIEAIKNADAPFTLCSDHQGIVSGIARLLAIQRSGADLTLLPRDLLPKPARNMWVELTHILGNKLCEAVQHVESRSTNEADTAHHMARDAMYRLQEEIIASRKARR